MHRRSGLFGVLYISLIAAIAAYFFRATSVSGGSPIPLAAFSVIMTLVFLLAAVSLEKESAFSGVYSASARDLTASVLGALAMATGCALSLPRFGTPVTMQVFASGAVSVVGLLGAAGLAAAAIVRARGSRPMAALYVFAVLFYVGKLFLDFRRWMHDPAILDYCYSLFALISFMLATYHAGAFCFDRGARRRLAFFSLAGVLFGAISLVGAELAQLLIMGGSMLWMLACAGQVMKK